LLIKATLKKSALLSSDADSPHGFWARRHPSDAIEDRDGTRQYDGSTGSVAVNGSGRATLVAMVQTADLWEGNDGT